MIWLKWFADLVLLLLIGLAGISGTQAQSVFADNFNRPDSAVVGNGWLDAPGNSVNLSIFGGALVNTGPFTIGTIYRPFDFSSGVHVHATLSQTDGFNGPPRFESAVALGNNGTYGSGLSVWFGRSDAAFNNSQVQLQIDGTIVAQVFTPFQYGSELEFDFTYQTSGAVAGTVMSGTDSFAFSFSTSYALAGGNVAIYLEKGVTIDPRIDNFSIASLPVSPVPEPSTYLSLVAGLLALAAVRHRNVVVSKGIRRI